MHFPESAKQSRANANTHIISKVLSKREGPFKFYSHLIESTLKVCIKYSCFTNPLTEIFLLIICSFFEALNCLFCYKALSKVILRVPLKTPPIKHIAIILTTCELNKDLTLNIVTTRNHTNLIIFHCTLFMLKVDK